MTFKYIVIIEPQTRGRKNSKSQVNEDETDVLYVTGTPMNLVAELPDSPSILRKLENTKFSITNENASRSPPRSRSDGIVIQKDRHFQPSLAKSLESPGKKQRGVSRNTSVTSLSSPFRRDGSTKEKGILKSPGLFDNRRVSRKASKAAPKDSSSDTSSDESQKALISRVSAATSSHSRKVLMQFKKKYVLF